MITNILILIALAWMFGYGYTEGYRKDLEAKDEEYNKLIMETKEAHRLMLIELADANTKNRKALETVREQRAEIIRLKEIR